LFLVEKREQKELNVQEEIIQINQETDGTGVKKHIVLSGKRIL
jgi:hypothetical protein